MSDAKPRDLSLYPGNYAYLQDTTKGVIKTYTGPSAITPTAQEVPVVYDPKKGTFTRCNSLEEAVRVNTVAVEGFYIELLNPAKDNAHPSDGSTQAGPELQVGRKINVNGPAMFALWPGQSATVIRGHHLRSNQYLLTRVYNEEEARKNWGNAIMKSASKLTPPTEGASAEEKKTYETALKMEKEALAAAAKPPADLTVGKLFIIRGTEVSFYIPPTGITVVHEAFDGQGKPIYTREALTLERLEYAILIDENGRKRYERGPTVVFPHPTERFMEMADEKDKSKRTRKFQAIELNDIQGIHIKVIADYKDEATGQTHKAGEELFITGKETAIYYPREEHAAIKYDGRAKHFATAVPAGEARYVLNRLTGKIDLRKGPDMMLPDPRTEIFVRRPLSDLQVKLWYPGNQEAQEFNAYLRNLSKNVPTTRSGAVSEGEIERSSKAYSKGARIQSLGMESVATYAANSMMDASNVSKEQGYVGDEVTRASSYTQPRSITLESKFQGVPAIELWTGYAALVVSKSGARRVEVGPTTIHLEYDEGLEVLAFSTGKPKNTDQLQKDVYLRVKNNKVSDIVRVETKDHVQVELRFSYLVNFEGEQEKWFAVENYVKLLCDHLRSILKGEIRKIPIEEFYATSTDIIRDILLGKDKKGMFFEANNMRLQDVEVLGVTIADPTIKQLLDGSQIDVVKANIEMSNLHRNMAVTTEKERITREEMVLKVETLRQKNDLEEEVLTSNFAVRLMQIGNAIKEYQEQQKADAEKQALSVQAIDSKLAIERKEFVQRQEKEKNEQEQRIAFIKAEAEAFVSKFKAFEGQFTNALLAISNNKVLVEVAEAWSIQRVLGGDTLSESFNKMFQGSPLAGIVKSITSGQTNGATDASKKIGNQPQV